MKGNNLILIVLTFIFSAIFYLPIIESFDFDKWLKILIAPICYFLGAGLKHFIFTNNDRTPDYRWSWRVELITLGVFMIITFLAF